MELTNREQGALYIALGTTMIAQDIDEDDAANNHQEALVKVMATQGIDRKRGYSIVASIADVVPITWESDDETEEETPTKRACIAQCVSLTTSFATTDDGLEPEDMEAAVSLVLELNELEIDEIAERISLNVDPGTWPAWVRQRYPDEYDEWATSRGLRADNGDLGEDDEENF